jgi:hypothetical protein
MKSVILSHPPLEIRDLNTQNSGVFVGDCGICALSRSRIKSRLPKQRTFGKDVDYSLAPRFTVNPAELYSAIYNSVQTVSRFTGAVDESTAPKIKDDGTVC